MLEENARRRAANAAQQAAPRRQVLVTTQGVYRLPVPSAWPMLDLPDDLVDMRCGARNRQGAPCRGRPTSSNGRCRFHGGAPRPSTG